MFVNECTG